MVKGRWPMVKGRSLTVAVILIIELFGSLPACAQSSEPVSYHYDFAHPDAEFKLHNDLKEISGLTLFDGQHLAALDDEHGRVYLIDIESGEITDDFKFARRGDYEGIERAGDRLFALRSDGQLLEIKQFDGDKPDSKKIETPLKGACDAEGLAHDPSGNRLLISCKEYPGKGLKRMRTVYALDLESLELAKDPVFTIRTDTIDAVMGIGGADIKNFVARFLDLDGFKPSAIAVHPKTGDLFILSSVLKVIVVLAETGKMRAIFPLDHKKMEQPEGLAFLPNGDLFVSSEGVHKKARLFRFNHPM